MKRVEKDLYRLFTQNNVVGIAVAVAIANGILKFVFSLVHDIIMPVLTIFSKSNNVLNITNFIAVTLELLLIGLLCIVLTRIIYNFVDSKNK